MNPPHLSDAELAALPGLPPAKRLRASDHLAACPECLARRAALEPTHRERLGTVFRDLTAAAREGTDYLDADTLRRLAELPAGPAEAADLRIFQRHLDDQPAESFGRGETLPGERADAVPEAAPRPWRWLLPRLVLPLAAIAMLVALAILPAQRSGPGGKPAEVALMDGPLQLRNVSSENRLTGLETLPADLQDSVRQAVTNGLLPGRRPAATGAIRGDVPDQASPSPALDGSGFRMLEPASGASLETDRPTLRWSPPPGAERQEVSLSSRLGGTTETRSGPLPVAESSWTPPAPLARGGIYRWRVTAFAADGRELAHAPAGEGAGASFKVLGEAAHERLEILRQHPSAGRSHLALGVAYAREGLHREAAAEFRALAAANPESPLARNLWRAAERSGE